MFYVRKKSALILFCFLVGGVEKVMLKCTLLVFNLNKSRTKLMPNIPQYFPFENFILKEWKKEKFLGMSRS